jgi:uncharacterized protein (DUF1697 family)
MPKYAAMIRGIGPSNPNMAGAKLTAAFESCGFTNIRPFLTSGNVLFDSEITDTVELEKLAEAALPRVLDFERDVYVRSQEYLQQLVAADPFKGLKHENSGKTYLTVTFFKQPPKLDYDFPYRPEGKAFRLLGIHERALCSVVDLTTGKTPDLMQWLDRRFHKQTTTRTWNTITRLLAKLELL